MMVNVADAARNKWPSILAALGIGQHFLTDKHGPCPICGGTDRFRFDDKDGRGTWFCNACRAGDGISLLMKVHGWSFKDAADQIRPVLGEAVEQRRDRSDSRDPIEASKRLWRQGHALVDGDQVTAYLSARVPGGRFGPSLRYLPDCRVTGVDGVTSLPAMLALVQEPSGKGASVHRTYLQAAAKAPIESPRRLMPGKIGRGSAIRLSPHGAVLGIAEGIETAIAVMRDFDVPCWAAVSADMLREFIWPDGVSELHVFGDADKKFGGQAAAFHLAHRASTAPRPLQTTVHIPPTLGHDWLDAGNAKLAAHAAE